MVRCDKHLHAVTAPFPSSWLKILTQVMGEGSSLLGLLLQPSLVDVAVAPNVCCRR